MPPLKVAICDLEDWKNELVVLSIQCLLSAVRFGPDKYDGTVVSEGVGKFSPIASPFL